MRHIFFLFYLLMVFHVTSTQAASSDVAPVEILLSPIPPLVMGKDQLQRGFLWDVAGTIVERLSKNSDGDLLAKRTLYPWKRGFSLLSNTPNKIMLQMARTPKRENMFHWISPTTQMSFAFIKLKQPVINTIDEALKSTSVAVYRASHLENFLRQKGFDSNLELTNDSVAGARLLNAGRVQAWYASVQEAKWLLHKGVVKKHVVIGKEILKFDIWAVASKGTSKSALEAIQTIITNMKADGTIDQLKSRYGI
ncbi:MAG: transporter substrate-binding domain-containing protein [Sneathiella sp.]